MEEDAISPKVIVISEDYVVSSENEPTPNTANTGEELPLLNNMNLNLNNFFDELGVEPLSQEKKDSQEDIEKALEILEKEVQGYFDKNNHNLSELSEKQLVIRNNNHLVTSQDAIINIISFRFCTRCGSTEVHFNFQDGSGVLKLEMFCEECQEVVISQSLDERVIQVGKTRPKSYLPNYLLLSFLLNGQYYKDYQHVLGFTGIKPLSAQHWIRIIDWISPYIKLITDWSISEARKQVVQRGDQGKLHIQFDGFYLTRGHYSNNSSATIHDQSSGNIIAYSHRSKRGKAANWKGTSSGAEGDMFSEMLDELLDSKFYISKCTIDKDASCQDILLSKSPETDVIICAKHRSKTFHTDLEIVKKTPCQKTPNGEPYKTKHVFTCQSQLAAFKDLLEQMAARADEYISTEGRFTTNTTEGYHGIALVHRDKKIDLGPVHYQCKTNMSILHKNIGPIWRVLLFQLLDIPVPVRAAEYMIRQQDEFEKKKLERQNLEYQKKRNMNKRKKKQRHDDENRFMESLNNVTETAIYTGDTNVESSGDESDNSSDDSQTDEEEQNLQSNTEISDFNYSSDDSDNDGSGDGAEEATGIPSPLFFLYDCEATGGVVYNDHITEIGAVVQPLPDGTTIATDEGFQALVNTSKRIAPVVSRKCGLRNRNILGKPKLSEVLPMFLDWLQAVTKEVSTVTRKSYFPVLLAHNGFVYDYPLLFAEIERRKPLLKTEMLSHLKFGDTLNFIREIRKSGLAPEKLQANKKQKLGLEGLFATYFPSEEYQAHRAYEDVQAMKRVMFKTELKEHINNIPLRSFEEQRRGYKQMFRVRVISKNLEYKLGKLISVATAKKLAMNGVDFEFLRSLYRTNVNSKESFVRALKEKKVSKVCQNRLVNHFYN